MLSRASSTPTYLVSSVSMPRCHVGDTPRVYVALVAFQPSGRRSGASTVSLPSARAPCTAAE